MKVNGPKPWPKVREFIDAYGRRLKREGLMLTIGVLLDW